MSMDKMKRGRFTITGGLYAGVLLAGITGCSANRVGLVGSPALNRHFAQGQVTDVTIALKQVGSAQGLTGRKPMKQSFLEGFIEGALVEWDGTPAAGVAVRAEWEGWANPAPASADDEDRPVAGQVLVPTLTPDEADPRAAVLADAQGGTAITDKDGRYRVPFALPLRNGNVEAAGKLIFSPDWGVQLEKIGRAFEPFSEEVPFQLFYYNKGKLLAYNEGFDRRAVRLRQTENQRRASTPKTSPNGEKSSLAALWLDLQLTLVNKRIEKEVAMSKAGNGIVLALPEPVIFSANQSEVTKPGQDLLNSIGPWIDSKRCRVVVHVTPGNEPTLAGRRASALKGALKRAGVPESRFLTATDTNASTGVTLLLLP